MNDEIISAELLNTCQTLSDNLGIDINNPIRYDRIAAILFHQFTVGGYVPKDITEHLKESPDIEKHFYRIMAQNALQKGFQRAMVSKTKGPHLRAVEGG